MSWTKIRPQLNVEDARALVPRAVSMLLFYLMVVSGVLPQMVHSLLLSPYLDVSCLMLWFSLTAEFLSH